MTNFLTLIAIIAIHSYAFASEIPFHGPTLEQQHEISLHNQRLNQKNSSFSLRQFKIVAPTVRPFAEYEKNGFLIFSDFDSHTSQIKAIIANNLPPDVNLAIIATNDSTAKVAMENLSKYLPASRIKIINVKQNSAYSLWARDYTPIPTISLADGSLNLVGANYYNGFEPDLQISQAFQSSLSTHNYYYEGGNFMPNRLGDCIVIDRAYNGDPLLSDKLFLSYYGCKRMVRLPKVKGIGHIDESVKFISDSVVITDTPQYVEKLKKYGYTVHIAPRPTGKWQTYINSLLVNGTLFLPVFDQATDAQAISLYQSLGLKVVPINSTQLSELHGSIHCITMNYPDVPLNFLLNF